MQDVFATCLQCIFRCKTMRHLGNLWHKVCLCALLRRQIGAFAMSFGRVCGVERVFAVLFRRETDVFATGLRCRTCL